jgi:hypothetical protein
LRGTLDRLSRWRIWSAAVLGLVGLGFCVLGARGAGYSVSCPTDTGPGWSLVAASVAVGVAAVVVGVRTTAGMIIGGIALILLALVVVSANSCRYYGPAGRALDRVEDAMPAALGPSVGKHSKGSPNRPPNPPGWDSMTYRTARGLDETAALVESSLIEAGMHPEPCGDSVLRMDGTRDRRQRMFCLPRDFDSEIGVDVRVVEPEHAQEQGTNVGVVAEECRTYTGWEPRNETCALRANEAAR